MTDAPTERAVLAMDAMPPHIKGRYARLALVTGRAHIERLDADDQDTLIVSCDWLLWHQAVAEGRHCVHYELGLLGWEPPKEMETDMFLRANDWLYEDGTDITLFNGVSLGKMFNPEMTMCLINYYRLERALSSLIERFRPDEVLFFDYRNDINILKRDLRVLLAQTVAGNHGVRFNDRGRGMNASGHRISEKPHARRTRPLWVRVVLFLYQIVLETASAARCVFADRAKRAFVMVNTNMAEPFIMNYSGGGLTPIFWSRTPPKKLRILWHCFVNGILFASPKEARLSPENRRVFAEFEGALRETLVFSNTGATGFLRAFAREEILDNGKMLDAVHDLETAERTITRYRPGRLVVDGFRGRPIRAYIETARRHGIDVDYIWHSPLTPQNLKYDALGGDPMTTPPITRCLSWGPLNNTWLGDVESSLPRIPVGSPWGGRYGSPAPGRRHKGKNVLLLQYTPNTSDLRGLNANMYGSFVTLVRTLKEEGYTNLRYKLHPGPGRWVVDYFEEISRFFGITCPILKTEPFAESVEWADIIIGPLLTGAMFEILTAGRPYYAMLLPPHRSYPDYYPGYPVYESIDAVMAAIGQSGAEKEIERLNRELLNKVCSMDAYPNGPKRFWEVLRGDFA